MTGNKSEAARMLFNSSQAASRFESVGRVCRTDAQLTPLKKKRAKIELKC